jgi:hypothetical protein
MNFWSEEYDAGASTSTLKEEDTLERNTSTRVFMELIWTTDPGRYWWPLAYSTWTPTIVSFGFSVSLIVAQFTIFGNFYGPELLEPF